MEKVINKEPLSAKTVGELFRSTDIHWSDKNLKEWAQLVTEVVNEDDVLQKIYEERTNDTTTMPVSSLMVRSRSRLESGRVCTRVHTRLLNAGADVNKANEDDETALVCAADSGYMEDVTLLLEHGSDVNKADEYGQTLSCAQQIVATWRM